MDARIIREALKSHIRSMAWCFLRLILFFIAIIVITITVWLVVDALNSYFHPVQTDDDTEILRKT